MSIEKNIKGLILDFTCGHCFAQSGYDVLFAEYSVSRGTWGVFFDGGAFAIVKCRHCEMLNLLSFQLNENDYGPSLNSPHEFRPYLEEHPSIITARYEGHVLEDILSMQLLGQFPHGHKLGKQIPDDIKRDIQEAASCLAVSAPNSAAIMCRRVIERLAIHFGVRERTLATTLKVLENKKLIDIELVSAFKEIKDWGNIGAHPKENDTGIYQAEAEKIVRFTYLIVERVFNRSDIQNVANELAKIRKEKNDVDGE